MSGSIKLTGFTSNKILKAKLDSCLAPYFRPCIFAFFNKVSGKGGGNGSCILRMASLIIATALVVISLVHIAQSQDLMSYQMDNLLNSRSFKITMFSGCAETLKVVGHDYC
jgi:hypothetical protein